LYGKETETLWYQYKKGLMGIQGTYFERWIEAIPSIDTKWKTWKKSHPDSRMMD